MNTSLVHGLTIGLPVSMVIWALMARLAVMTF
jgi:hypothetical protein